MDAYEVYDVLVVTPTRKVTYRVRCLDETPGGTLMCFLTDGSVQAFAARNWCTYTMKKVPAEL